jgi:shikimate dehydrogenase
MRQMTKSEAGGNRLAKKVLLLGQGIGKSISPAIHQRAFAEVGFSGTYELLDLETTEFETDLQEIRASSEIIGFNVTIPYKEKILPYLQFVDEQAKQVGAVNTVKFDPKRTMAGFNTDVDGIIATFSQLDLIERNAGGRAVILGAGGAARACAYVALQKGFDYIAILNRSPGRAAALAAEFGGNFPGRKLVSSELERKSFENFIGDGCRLLINTIPPSESLPFRTALETASPSMKYFELSYLGGSSLMKAVQARRLKAIDGLLMLVEQAANSFEIWTGISAPREAMLLEAQAQVSRRQQ